MTTSGVAGLICLVATQGLFPAVSIPRCFLDVLWGLLGWKILAFSLSFNGAMSWLGIVRGCLFQNK